MLRFTKWYKENKAKDRLFEHKLAVAEFNVIVFVALAIGFGAAFYYAVMK